MILKVSCSDTEKFCKYNNKITLYADNLCTEIVRNGGVSGRKERIQMHNVVRMRILIGLRQ